jgi:hypothetical protein
MERLDHSPPPADDIRWLLARIDEVSKILEPVYGCDVRVNEVFDKLFHRKRLTVIKQRWKDDA